MVGPSFSRIYDAEIGPFDKFKHVIEPRVDYDYVSDVTDPATIPAFDDVDIALGRNQVRYAMVNRLLARPKGGKAGSAQEIASLEIAQTYLFELPQTIFPIPPEVDLRRQTGPVEATLRLIQRGLLHVDGRLIYDTHGSQVTATSLTAA